MILNKGEVGGRRFIRLHAIEAMFINQIGDRRITMRTVRPDRSHDVNLLPGCALTHTTAFLRNEDTLPGVRSTGSRTCGGVINTHYWIDPTRGLVALFMTQLLPFCDLRFMNAYRDFERCVCWQFTASRTR